MVNSIHSEVLLVNVAPSRPMYSRRWILYKRGSTPAGNLQNLEKVTSLALRDVDGLHHYRCLGGREYWFLACMQSKTQPFGLVTSDIVASSVLLLVLSPRWFR